MTPSSTTRTFDMSRVKAEPRETHFEQFTLQVPQGAYDAETMMKSMETLFAHFKTHNAKSEKVQNLAEENEALKLKIKKLEEENAWMKRDFERQIRDLQVGNRCLEARMKNMLTTTMSAGVAKKRALDEAKQAEMRKEKAERLLTESMGRNQAQEGIKNYYFQHATVLENERNRAIAIARVRTPAYSNYKNEEVWKMMMGEDVTTNKQKSKPRSSKRASNNTRPTNATGRSRWDRFATPFIYYPQE